MSDPVLDKIIEETIKNGCEIITKKVSEFNKTLWTEIKKGIDDKKNKIKIERIDWNKAISSHREIKYINKNTVDLLKKHIEEIFNWSSDIGFRDLSKNKELNKIYIELDTYLIPRSTHLSDKESDNKVPIINALNKSNEHCIVLGQPGAGKTTSMKKLCRSFFITNNRDIDNRFPILIRYRDIESYNKIIGVGEHSRKIYPVLSELLKIINIDVEYITDDDVLKNKIHIDDIIYDINVNYLLSIIDSLECVLILDGFDEIPTHIEKEYALNELRLLTSKLKRSKIITTCRSGEFYYSIDRTETFELAPLSKKQIKSFVYKWIVDEDKAKKFINDILNSPFADTAIKPLSLAHLCAIYERIGSIPDRPKTVYKKIVSLLLEEWDTQRSIRRSSSYASFEPDRKFEFLSHLAFYLTTVTNTTVFSQEQLEIAYKDICKNFNLPIDEYKEVAKEIESHTGLFLKAGFQKYEFAHKSLQEYLSAEYIVRLPIVDILEEEIIQLGAELAIATSISSNPSLYFSNIVFVMFRMARLANPFYSVFIDRLILEKPDFYPCEEVVLASFALLSKSNHDQRLINIVERILSKSSIESILEYYKVVDDQGDRSILILRKQHKKYKLPKKIIVPLKYSVILGE